MARARDGLILMCVLALCGADAPPAAVPAGPDAAPVPSPPIKLSAVQPMDGNDPGGLGGIHKIAFVDAMRVVSVAPWPGQSPDEVLGTGLGFSYVRQYGVAILSGGPTGGSVLVRLYIYPGFEHRFTCYVGLPGNPDPKPVGEGEKLDFKLTVQPSSAGQANAALKNIEMKRVEAIDGAKPSGPLAGLVRLGWRIEPQGTPAAVAIAIGQEKKISWSFHMCSIERRKP